VFKHAYDNGVTLFNSATFYGPLNEEGFGANLRLIRKCLEQTGVDRSKLQLMVKICMDTRAPVEKTGTQWNLRGDADYVREDVDYALKTLNVEYIDIIVLCRLPREVEIETTITAMSQMVKEGKARHIALSEAPASYIRRAHAVHPVYCIEQEWSLQTRDIEENIVPTCRELGVKIVAYSPLGRGMLTGAFRAQADIKDWRSHNPRFSEENLPKNLQLIAAAEKIAERNSCSLGQLALAWLQAQGTDVIPIPGTTKLTNLTSNLAARNVKLLEADV
jgi:aryl-alcohol dehydrogenase-like predicted oxidoreductase